MIYAHPAAHPALGLLGMAVRARIAELEAATKMAEKNVDNPL